MLIYEGDVMFLRRACRSILPPRERQILAGLLRKVLGRNWKNLYFEEIDRTSLKAISAGHSFDAGLKLAPFFISRPGAVFDIGANTGGYTYVLEKSAGAQNTFALEPVPHLASRLMSLFPEVNILTMALSDVEGTLDLKAPVIDGLPEWGRGTLEQFQCPEPRQTGAVVEQVSVRTLDTLCAEMDVQDVRFIKIDVEGHEHNVLRGAVKTLEAWHPVLLVEIEQRHHVKPVDEVFGWIEAQGYRGFFYNAQQVLLRPIEQFNVDSDQRLGDHGDISYINNFYFVQSAMAHEVIDKVNRAIRHG